VQGEGAPGQALRLSYNILQAAGSRIFKTDYVALPLLWTDTVQPANHNGQDQSRNIASEGRKDRHHGLPL